jgi:hypothetical protein
MENNLQIINENNKIINENNSLFIGNLRRVNGLNKNSKKLISHENPFKIKLKSHQEVLLYRVIELDEKASLSNLPFGIMSDKPGSGKTFVILALIYYSIKFFNSKGSNIIVVPHNIYTQWINAIDNFLGKLLKYLCLIDYKEINQLYVDKSILYNYDIIITTPLIYDVFAATINSLNIYVRRIFFDEADSMKNLLVNAINSKMTWFVSASISSVFDSVTLKAKIGKYDLYLPNLLTNECWCESEFIDSNIKLPKVHLEQFICKNFYIDLILSNILTKEQLKFINAHDYTNIRNECGGYMVKSTQDIIRHLYEYSNKIILDTSAVIKELDKNKVKAPDTKNKTLMKKQLYLKRIENIKIIALKYKLCINCFEHFSYNVGNPNKLPCGDLICQECVKKNNLCLTCNKIHPIDTLTEEYFKSDKIIKEFLLKSKLDKFKILESILEICDKKIIIYSEFRGLHNYLKNYSINNNIKIEELNGGNIKDIDKILIRFKNEADLKILLIDDAYFGVGVNIEYTTDLIFFHNIENKIKTQLIGRAQRYGRKNSLNIWEIKYWNEENYSMQKINKSNNSSSSSEKESD